MQYHIAKRREVPGNGSEIQSGDSSSPAIRYLLKLNSDSGRRTMANAITFAAALLFPGAVPEVAKNGREGNSKERFAIAAALPWHGLSIERLGLLRAQLLRLELAPATKNKILAAVRGVLDQCRRAHLITRDMQADSQEVLENIAAHTEPKGKHISKIELARIFAACSRDDSSIGARDSALIALLAIGLRRAEVASVKLGDYAGETGKMLVRGKGMKERTVWLTNGAKDAIEAWLEVRGTVGGSFLCAVNKGAKLSYEAMTAQSIYAALQNRASEAMVECTPHDLRRTFAGEALSAGVDIATVQSLMGHASPATTARYDRRPEETRRRAMESIAIPYRRAPK